MDLESECPLLGGVSDIAGYQGASSEDPLIFAELSCTI